MFCMFSSFRNKRRPRIGDEDWNRQTLKDKAREYEIDRDNSDVNRIGLWKRMIDSVREKR